VEWTSGGNASAQSGPAGPCGRERRLLGRRGAQRRRRHLLAAFLMGRAGRGGCCVPRSSAALLPLPTAAPAITEIDPSAAFAPSWMKATVTDRSASYAPSSRTMAADLSTPPRHQRLRYTCSVNRFSDSGMGITEQTALRLVWWMHISQSNDGHRGVVASSTHI
jgi:hypothetical protein